jgi:hypothetical protein
MVAEVVLSVMSNRSDRRFPNLSCPWALEAAEVTRRKRAHFHQGPERTTKLHTEAEYMAATGFTIHPTIVFRSGLGPYKGHEVLVINASQSSTFRTLGASAHWRSRSNSGRK